MSSQPPSRRRPDRFITLLFISLIVVAIVLFQGERWLKALLLYLSHATWARDLVSRMTLAKKVSSRFVAGETSDDAIYATKLLNNQGLLVTLDYLGESVTDEGEAFAARDEIIGLLEKIERSGINANVSVKLSQLGLEIHKDLAHDNLRLILEKSRKIGNQIRIDMEDSTLTDATLELYRRLRDEDQFGHRVGIVLQAYLYRSEDDVKQLIDEGARIRLCKGAYAEPPNVAFPRKEDTDQNFVKLTKLMLSDDARANGVHPAVATHDEAMIDATLDYVRANNIPADAFEFQMLYGIRRDLQLTLAAEGYRVRVYVPYGSAWYPYLVRRLAERPANLWFFVTNLFRK